MERLTRAGIRRAIEALAEALPASGTPRELWIVGGAALVLLYGARDTTKDVHGLAPGERLFDDLGEADRGHP